MEKISLKQRDIILVPFPFSDQSNSKVRPALIASNNEFNHSQDIIVLGITSNHFEGKYKIAIEKKDLEWKNIEEECYIKTENILKIRKSLVIKKVDILQENSFDKVKLSLQEMFRKE